METQFGNDFKKYVMKEITGFFLALFISILEISAQGTVCNDTVNYAWLQANAPNRYQQSMALENFTANYVATSGRLINPDGLISNSCDSSCDIQY